MTRCVGGRGTKGWIYYTPGVARSCKSQPLVYAWLINLGVSNWPVGLSFTQNSQHVQQEHDNNCAYGLVLISLCSPTCPAEHVHGCVCSGWPPCCTDHARPCGPICTAGQERQCTGGSGKQCWRQAWTCQRHHSCRRGQVRQHVSIQCRHTREHWLWCIVGIQ